MAFSNLSYLHEVREGIASFAPDVRHFCLVAPVAVVNERIRLRGGTSNDRDLEWQYRRAAECCSVHSSPEFVKQIAVGDKTADEIAEHILTVVAK